jgi:hypothetical protein
MEPSFKRDILQGAHSYFSTWPAWNSVTGRDPAPARDWGPIVLERLLTVVEQGTPKEDALAAISEGLTRDQAHKRLGWLCLFLRLCRFQPLPLHERAALEWLLAAASDLLHEDFHNYLTCQLLEQPTPEEIIRGAGPSFTAPERLAYLATVWPFETSRG